MELLAVPNISEGRDTAALGAIREAFERGGAEVLDVSSDPDHHRSVFTLRAPQGALAEAVTEGAREAIHRLDINSHEGVHPRIGVVDVAPVVYLEDEHRGAAIVEAIQLAELLGREQLPVYLYGLLAGGRTRAEIRRTPHQHEPDYGPPIHPTAGATLVAARPPLIAFNVEIDATLDTAKQIAAKVRQLPGVVALGLELPSRGVVQVSTNLEHTSTPRDVLHAVQQEATVTQAELVALARRQAFADWPAEVPLQGAHRATL